MNLRSLIPVSRDPAFFGAGYQPFATLQREVDRLFDDFTRGFPATRGADMMPSLDVTETDKEIEITVELPGLEEKDVQISVADGLLTIKGEKKAEKEQKDKNYRLVERSYGSFARTLQLPAWVNPDQIEASIAKGVLTVRVPKPAPAQTRTVEVKAAA